MSVWGLYVLSVASLLLLAVQQMGAVNRYCEDDICRDRSRLFCPRSRVILVTAVSCSTRSRCPTYVYRNVARYCSMRAACDKTDILVASALCSHHRTVVVRYTCISEDTTTAFDRTCGLTRLDNDLGFIATPRYPALSPHKACSWTVPIHDGAEVQIIIYDLSTSSLVRDKRPTVAITTSGARQNCTGVTSPRVITMDTPMPVVAEITCHKFANIALRGNNSDSRLLLYYTVGEGNHDDRDASRYLPHPSVTSSCTGSSNTGKWYRIYHIRDRTTQKHRPFNDTINGPMSKTVKSTVAMAPVTLPAFESSLSGETEMLLGGIGAGVGICAAVIIPLVCCCVWCIRNKGTPKEVQEETDTNRGNHKSLHFHECTFITDNDLESPVYATIDENQLRRTPPIECDPYGDVIDKLPNPPPPPRRLISITRDRDAGSGNTYAEIQQDVQFCRVSGALKVIKEIGASNGGPVGNIHQHRNFAWDQQRPKLGRSQSEPSHPRSVFIFPTNITNCYA